MKKVLILCAIFFTVSNTSNAQLFEWGIKGGLNYNSNGDLIIEAEDIYVNPEGNSGYHLGFFAKTKGKIYVRPELFYTHTKSKYKGDGGISDLTIDKIDLPILLGLKIIGPLHFLIGPSFQYLINTDLSDFKLGDIENDFTIGGTVGLGVQLGKIGIDLRYERGFSENEVELLNLDELGTIDVRSKQLIASVSFKF